MWNDFLKTKEHSSQFIGFFQGRNPFILTNPVYFQKVLGVVLVPYLIPISQMAKTLMQENPEVRIKTQVDVRKSRWKANVSCGARFALYVVFLILSSIWRSKEF